MKVFVRLRPAGAGEAGGGYSDIPSSDRNAVAERTFDSDCSQAEFIGYFFGRHALDSIAFASDPHSLSRHHVLPSTRHSLMIAYGQTGAGKTHSVLGPPGCLTEAALAASGGRIPPSWGVFPAVAASAVMTTASTQALATTNFITVSCVEIYMNSLYDLLDERRPIKVEGASVRANARRVQNSVTERDSATGKWRPPTAASTTAVQSIAAQSRVAIASAAREMPVATLRDVVVACRAIDLARSSQKHSLNDRSSRSHCLITLKVQHVDSTTGDLLVSTTVFADLAGSERVRKSGVVADTTGAARKFSMRGITVDLPSTRLDEARCINNSLSALGRVLNGVARGDRFVSFRDTTLSQVLKPLLSNPEVDIKVLLAVSDAASNSAETRSTLRFGASLLAATSTGKQKACRRRSRTVSPVVPAADALSSGGRGSASLGAQARLQPSVSERIEQLEAAAGSLRDEIAAMDSDGRGGHVVVAPEFPAPTRQAFMDNREKLAAATTQVRCLRQQLLERRSELSASGMSAAAVAGDPQAQQLQQSLVKAQGDELIYKGIVLRQMSTGIWAPPCARYDVAKAELERVEREFQFLTHAM